MPKVKISVIGAGSANFSLELVKDLCLTPSLSGSTVSFVDINESKLGLVHSLATRYAKEMKAELKIEKTTDRRASLSGADFVVNLALVVGHTGYTRVWELARRHGYHFGGSYHVMHDEGFWINYYQFRLFEEVAKDILEVCPDAWNIQLANPVLAATTLICREFPKLRYVGLCEGPRAIYTMAETFGLDPDQISFVMPGVNHFVWLTNFLHKGEDAYPVLDRWVETKSRDYWKTCPPSDILGPSAVELYRRFHVFPVGDTCTPGGGAWPWWHHTDSEVEKRFCENPQAWWDSYLREIDARGETIRKMLQGEVSLAEAFPPVKSRQFTVPVIESIAWDVPRVIPVNILNSRGYLPGVPNDFEVEVPGLVSGNGIQGIPTSGLPSNLIGYILKDRVAPVETEIEAYKEGSKDKLTELVMMDPWTRSEKQAKSFLDDVFADSSFPELKKHYN
jgi:alpha-galactosidase